MAKNGFYSLFYEYLGYFMFFSGLTFILFCILNHTGWRTLDLSGQQTHAVLHNGKVIAVQPDSSLTILDAGTGEVALRGDALTTAFKSDFRYGFEIKPYMNLALVSPISFPPSNDLVVSLENGSPIVTGKNFRKGAMETHDNQLFALVKTDGDNANAVYCLDMEKAALVWRKTVTGKWGKIFVDDKLIYLQSLYRNTETSIFDRNMMFIEKSRSASTLQNKEENEFRSAFSAMVDNRDKVKNAFGDSIRFSLNNISALPNDGIVAITYPSSSSGKMSIHFRGGQGHTWEAQLDNHSRTLPPYFINFSFSADDTVVVYTSNYGIMECRNISTGQLLWTYAFPRRSMQKWNADYPTIMHRFSIANWIYDSPRTHFWNTDNPINLIWFLFVFLKSLGSDFFTDDKKIYDEDMSYGIESSNAGEMPPDTFPRKIIDPKTIQFDGTSAGIIGWLAIAITVPVILIITLFAPQHDIILNLLLGLIAIDIAVLLFFGRYDRIIFGILWYSILFLYTYIGHLLTKRTSFREDAPTRH